MSVKEIPSIDYLRQCFRYDDGRLYWLDRPANHFASDSYHQRWIKQFSGKEAGSSVFKPRVGRERSLVHVKRKPYRRYRIVWAMHKGEWPTADIDHINRDALDDRIENLRLADQTQNSANAKRAITSTSGFKGAHRNNNRNCWESSITCRGIKRFLGFFDDPAKAHAAYMKAARELFGEFACSGED